MCRNVQVNQHILNAKHECFYKAEEKHDNCAAVDYKSDCNSINEATCKRFYKVEEKCNNCDILDRKSDHKSSMGNWRLSKCSRNICCVMLMEVLLHKVSYD